MERSRFAPLLVACLIAAACTPAVEVIHTVPPEVSIMPAKVVAVIGRSGAKPPNDVEDDFLNLFLRTLRSRGAWDVLDERAKARTTDLETYRAQTKADVIARVHQPVDNCTVGRDWMSWDEDSGDTYSYGVDCPASLDLIDVRTGKTIASVDSDGTGEGSDGDSAWWDAMRDSAVQLVNGFTPRQDNEQIVLDDKAPLAREGIARVKKGDLAGARALWEAAVPTLPPSASLLYNLGVVCEALRDFDAARKYYDLAGAEDALADLETRIKDADEARKTQAMLDAEVVAAAAEKKATIARAAQKEIDDAIERGTRMGEEVFSTPSGLKYLLMPAGTFMMGCTEGDDGCWDFEKPAHLVTLTKPFYMALTPTTNAQYQTCVEAGMCRGEADMSKPVNPVVDMSLNDARELCEWAGARLPTEAEWEWAARGGVQDWRFPWGNDDTGFDHANFADACGQQVQYTGVDEDKSRFTLHLVDPPGGTTPVGSFGRNGFGLFDMSGNVAEWTSSRMGDYTDAAVTDPTGPETGREYVLRGGSWVSTSWGGRVSMRHESMPTITGGAMGFRCARDAG